MAEGENANMALKMENYGSVAPSEQDKVSLTEKFNVNESF